MTVLRVHDPAVDPFGPDGYPLAWHAEAKHLVREMAGHRCERCGHPYRKGDGEWSQCDAECRHEGPVRASAVDAPRGWDKEGAMRPVKALVEAQWRILTVHHLNGVKGDLRWWNLAALCQRCHLTIQGKVLMERVWPWEHSEWFKPHAAGWYAVAYLGLDLPREQVLAQMDELLALERAA